MLEYLFDFIERNLILIFLCVLVLGIASAYSKGIKFLLLSILGVAASYFALLCLYRLGIGVEFLYNISCDFVTKICQFIDSYGFTFINHSIILTKILNLIMFNSTNNIFVYIFHITMIVVIIFMMCYIILPKLKLLFHKNIRIDIQKINKKPYFYNTINRVQSKFILNSCFRC